MEQPSIPERLGRMEVQLTHMPTRVELYEKLDVLRSELQRQSEEQAEAINRLYVFIIGTALTSLTLGLGGMTLILTQLPI